MISCRYTDRGAQSYLTITGHAGYAPRGYDIVCAGVSALYESLLHGLGKYEPGFIPADDGFTLLHPSGIGKAFIENFLDCVKDLETQYPDHIELEIKRD